MTAARTSPASAGQTPAAARERQRLHVLRHDRRDRASITLAGEIYLDSAPLLRASLQQCLRDGIRHMDVDLATVTFCDCSGLNVFLATSQLATQADATLRLHHPQPMLRRLFTLTGADTLLTAPHDDPGPRDPDAYGE